MDNVRKSYIFGTKIWLFLIVNCFDIAWGKDGECCHILKLEASLNGKAYSVQEKSMGLYYQNPWKRLNEYLAFTHKSQGRSFMMDKRSGWQVYIGVPVNSPQRKFPDNYKGQVRTKCKSKCPEDCKNYNEWQYHDMTTDDEDMEWFNDDSMRITCEDEKYENLSTSEHKFNSSKGGNLEINTQSFGSKMSFCDVTTPTGQHLNFSKPKIVNEIQSLENERLKLVNVNDSKCKIVVSNPNVDEDEGIWYFMIIQKRNIHAQWYLHRVVVTFLYGRRYSTNGAPLNSLSLQLPYIAVAGFVTICVCIVVGIIVRRKMKNRTGQARSATDSKYSLDHAANKGSNNADQDYENYYDIPKPKNRNNVISMPTPSGFQRNSVM